MLRNEYKLDTPFGAYLSQQQHFCPNGLVGFVLAVETLQGYIDASGKEETFTDSILTVNGLLSTPSKWQEFDNRWQAFLNQEGFKPDAKTGKYVFHTSPFWAGKCNLMPNGMTEHTKLRIYRSLIEIIRECTLYRFGYGVFLEEFREIETEFPHVRESFLKKPGTRMALLCFRHNDRWARSHGYTSLAYMFDRGDKFFGEMYGEYRQTVNRAKEQGIDLELSISSIADGNKAMHSPLQGADLLAWECRRYFHDLPSDVRRRQSLASHVFRPRFELRMLNTEGACHLVLFGRDALRAEIRDVINGSVSDEHLDVLIGADKPFDNIDDLARSLFQMDKTTTIADAKARQARAKARKAGQ
jgi:hypothetical protein